MSANGLRWVDLFAGGRVPGQVPRQQLPTTDRGAYSYTYTAPTGTAEGRISTPQAVVADLGLAAGFANLLVKHMQQEADSARHELDFRRGVMSLLLAKSVEPKLRRALLERALQFYRSSYTSKFSADYKLLRKAYGGKYSHKETKDNGKVRYVYSATHDTTEGQKVLAQRLREKLGALIDRFGTDGVPVERLAPLVDKYGQAEVTTALQEFGTVTVTAGRMFIAGRHAVGAKTALQKSESFVPPAAVRAAARRGLELRRKAGGKGGLSSTEAGAQGIGSGVVRATTLSQGKALSRATVRQMHRFFLRHAKNKTIDAGKQPHEDRGYVAWLLWGGDAGARWAAAQVRKMDAAEVRKAADTMSKASGGVAPNVQGKTSEVGQGYRSNQVGSAAGAVASEGATGHTGTEPLEVGEKRIWGNRILEKKPDGKWHVVGHVAGLEGEVVPGKRTKAAQQGGVSFAIRALTKEQADLLLVALRAQKKGKKGKKKAAEAKNGKQD